jgi:hypothetical protein
MSSSSHPHILGLFSSDAAVRGASAAGIYNQGLALAAPVVSSWSTLREFHSLVWGQPVTVGLAVFPGTFARILRANGNPHLARVPPDQDVEEFELQFPTGISLDILTTRDPLGEGALARFLKRFGEGIQQVEFRCLDVDRATAVVTENFGLAPVYPQARAGADDTRINFFLAPVDTGGKVLVELYEIAETHRSEPPACRS